MRRKVEFKPTSNLGQGNYIAVLADQRPAGRIARNALDEWCYYSSYSNTLNPEIINRDLDKVKQAVVARLQR